MAQAGSFGDWLRRVRKTNDLTQAELGEKLAYSVDAIRKYEGGGRPSKQLVKKLADFLGLAPEDLSDFQAFARGQPPWRGTTPPIRFTDLANYGAAVRRLYNVPHSLTEFIGREREVSDLTGALGAATLRERLVTLTGPPGVGKTQLGRAVAAKLFDHFSGGVVLVDLAPVRDPGLVASAVARAVDVRDEAHLSSLEGITRELRDRHLLLVLDNFEHVTAAAPFVSDLLQAAPRLTVLVTSQHKLHVGGERVFWVEPFASPDPDGWSPAQIASNAAVQLFVQRAEAADPGFRADAESLRDVARLCRHLEGLPLAIELAAARSDQYAPRALLRHANRRLELSGRRVDVPEHQRALRSTLAWSYRLLDPAEQAVFRQVGVFVGGFTLEAATAVCGPPREADTRATQAHTVEDALTSLRGKSLLQWVKQVDEDSQPAGPRYWMLETLREFALEELKKSGEEERTQRQHAAYHLALAEQAELGLPGRDEVAWLDRLETEHGNLRAALTWYLLQENAAKRAMRLAGALAVFWYLRGYWREGRAWLEGVLALAGASAPTATRAKALLGDGGLASFQGDYDVACLLLGESVSIYRQAADTQGLAFGLAILGLTKLAQGDGVAAQTYLEESEALEKSKARSHEVRRTWSLILSVNGLGDLYYLQGKYEDARRRFHESHDLSKQLESQVATAGVLNDLTKVVLVQGDYDSAGEFGKRALELGRATGIKRFLAIAHRNLGCLALNKHEYVRALGLLQESVRLFWGIGDQFGIQEGLESVAGVAGRQRQPLCAARLLGAADRLRTAIGVPLLPTDQRLHDCTVTTALHDLGETTFRAAWQDGRSMSLEQAIDLALTAINSAPPDAP